MLLGAATGAAGAGAGATWAPVPPPLGVGAGPPKYAVNRYGDRFFRSI